MNISIVRFAPLLLSVLFFCSCSSVVPDLDGNIVPYGVMNSIKVDDQFVYLGSYVDRGTGWNRDDNKKTGLHVSLNVYAKVLYDNNITELLVVRKVRLPIQSYWINARDEPDAYAEMCFSNSSEEVNAIAELSKSHSLNISGCFSTIIFNRIRTNSLKNDIIFGIKNTIVPHGYNEEERRDFVERRANSAFVNMDGSESAVSASKEDKKNPILSKKDIKNIKMSFFETENKGSLPISSRRYGEHFNQNATQYIYFEIKVDYISRIKELSNLSLYSKWYKDNALVEEESYQHYVDSGSTWSKIWCGYGDAELGKYWNPGDYTAIVYDSYDNELSRGSFTVK